MNDTAALVTAVISGLILGWATLKTWIIWRSRPPVVRGPDGVWRAQRGRCRVEPEYREEDRGAPQAPTRSLGGGSPRSVQTPGGRCA